MQLPPRAAKGSTIAIMHSGRVANGGAARRVFDVTNAVAAIFLGRAMETCGLLGRVDRVALRRTLQALDWA